MAVFTPDLSKLRMKGFKKDVLQYTGIKASFLRYLARYQELLQAKEKGAFLFADEKRELEELREYPFQDIKKALCDFEEQVLLSGDGLFANLERYCYSLLCIEIILTPIPEDLY